MTKNIEHSFNQDKMHILMPEKEQPRRTWDELTLAEVVAAYNTHAKYQTEDMGTSGWVDFAVALQTVLKEKNT
ncbi:MAG: hypothetical protein ACKO0Z_10320 [Betaproteobacteria bacterium]